MYFLVFCYWSILAYWVNSYSKNSLPFGGMREETFAPSSERTGVRLDEGENSWYGLWVWVPLYSRPRTSQTLQLRRFTDFVHHQKDTTAGLDAGSDAMWTIPFLPLVTAALLLSRKSEGLWFLINPNTRKYPETSHDDRTYKLHLLEPLLEPASNDTPIYKKPSEWCQW